MWRIGGAGGRKTVRPAALPYIITAKSAFCFQTATAVKKKRRVYNTRIVCLGQIGKRMENIGRQRPIGVFDSGIGGLTNVRALMERLPMENIIYFGDTARVPYGTKSKATIENFSMQIVDFLLEHDVKAMVIACNTIAAVAGQKIRQKTGNIAGFGRDFRSARKPRWQRRATTKSALSPPIRQSTATPMRAPSTGTTPIRSSARRLRRCSFLWWKRAGWNTKLPA